MDYEKAYNDALERARKIKNGEDDWRYSDLIEIGPALIEIFPELRESEDEMALRIIRKRMCYDPVPISDEDRRIVENWLEKQKEQKLAPSEEDTLMLTVIIQTLERLGGRGTTGMQIDWLKSRLPLFNSSKEDKRILKGIIGKIDHDQTYGVSKVEMLTFLKRLLS